MLDILAITGPIYIIVFLGYLATRGGLFAKVDMRVFGKFVINLALPALLFNALAQRHVADIVNPGYVAAYLGGSLLSLAIAYACGRRLAGMNHVDSTLLAMGSSCSNSSFVGFPVLSLVMAPVAGVAFALNVIIENVLMLPLLLAIAEAGRTGQGGESWPRLVARTLAPLARNPMIVALAAGLAFSLLELRLPEAASRVVTLFAQASGVLSLFVIGGALVGLPLAGTGRQALPVAFGKLVIHPLSVLLVATVLPWLGMPLDPALATAAVLMAAMPAMSILPLLAQKYGRGDQFSAALLACTAGSFVTLSVLLWRLQ
jgi:predicted permease